VRRGEAKLQTWCRACFAEVNAANYARNREREKARLVAQTNARRDENRRNIVAYLLAHPCVDCGEKDIVVLEFDHRGGKIGDISTYANSGRTWPRVLREIEKCDVRCASCHRRETARRNAERRRHTKRVDRPRPAVQLELTSAVEMRTCRVCGEVKPLSHFPFRSVKNRRRHWICLECCRERASEWYERSIGRAARPQRARGTARRDALVRRVFAYLIEHPCVDCGERDPIVLDFDHRGGKISAISTLVRDRAEWVAIAAEIAKCDVRCANCHRRKTAEEVGSYRLKA